MRRRPKRLLLWTAVIGLMALIFAFSAQQGSASNGMTEAAVMPLAEMLAEAGDGSKNTVLMIYSIIGTIVRKAAHLAEYALLSLLVHLLLISYGQKRKWPAIVICVLYAVTDEMHQAFVPGRVGAAIDVVIDAVGVTAGVFIPDIIKRLLRNRRKKHVFYL